MTGLFRAAYSLYRFTATAISPFNAKAKKWVEGRKSIANDLAGLKQSDHVMWFHAASLGEYEMGRPLLLEMKRRFPEAVILVTFFSPSGYEHRKNDSAHDFASYLPHDNPRAVRKFLDLAHPTSLTLVKYEFWPVLIGECLKRGVATSVVSATFRQNQFLFGPFGGTLRKLLGEFKMIAVQNESSKNVLEENGFKNVVLTGDGRFDNVLRLESESFEHPILEAFCQERDTLIGGSIWKEDEDVLLPHIIRFPHLNFLLAPHDVSKSNVQRLIERIPSTCLKLSECDENTSFEDVRVLVVDSIGILSKAYRFGKLAFVGGGFKTGLHNILEPAVYGLPVAFGPQHAKFWEAQALIDAGGATQVTTIEDAKIWLESMSKGGNTYRTASNATQSFVNKNAGSTQRTADILTEYFRPLF